MRILFVQKDLWPRSVGGAELYAHHLALALAARHEVTVFCSRRAGAPPVQSALRVIETPACLELHPGTAAERIVLEDFGRALDEVRPDVVHVQDLVQLSLAIPGRARDAGVPVVQTVHDYTFLCPRVILRTTREARCGGPTIAGCFTCGRDDARARYRRREQPGETGSARAVRSTRRATKRTLSAVWTALARPQQAHAAMARVERLLCPSRFLLERLREAGAPETALRHVPYGMPDVPCVPKLPSASSRFAFLGNPARHKGIFVLLEAARLAPEITLTIHGPVHAELEEAAAGLGNVHLAGTLADDDKARAFAEIDVLVVPSIWWENQPLTILEAFQQRTPVVASRVGALEELLAPGGGWLVEPDDPGALAATLRTLAADPERIADARATIPDVPRLTEHAAIVEAIHDEVVGR